MNENIVSLCYVSKRGERSVELCRIADYVDGELHPYVYIRDSDFNGSNRDLIYASANEIREEQGSIGFCEWSAYLDEYQNWRTRTISSNLPWTEVVQMKCITAGAMLALLKRGWSPEIRFDGKHDIIFCTASYVNPAVEAIYVPSYAFECIDNKWYISSAISSVDIGRIDYKKDTCSCACRYAKNDGRRYLRRVDAWKAESKLLTQSVDEIITGIVQSTIGGMALSRKERQLVRNALDALDHNYVMESIMQKLECSEEKAKKHLHDYLASRTYRLDRDEAVDIMEKLIAIDSEYVRMLREKIRKEWEQEQNVLLQKAQREVDDKRKALHNIEEEIQSETEKVEEAKQKQMAIQHETDKMTQLKNDVERQVAERLQSIRDDRAAALADSAFLLATVYPVNTANSAKKAEESAGCTTMDVDDNKEERQFLEAMPDILEACAEICGDDQETYEGMALFLLAAYACNQPLLLIGETAEEIADLYAASATGRDCIKICLNDDLPIDKLEMTIMSHSNACVCIVDGLNKGYEKARELMRRLPDTRFVLTANHLESLIMEPESLFTTFIPVATDLFCENSRVETRPDASCSIALTKFAETARKSRSMRDIRAKQKKWFANEFISPLFDNRCAVLQSCIHTLASELRFGTTTAENACRLFVFLTRLRILRKTEALKALLEEGITLNEDRIITLRAFAKLMEQ